MKSSTTGTIHISKLIMWAPTIASLGFSFSPEDEKKVDDYDGTWTHAANITVFVISNCSHCLATEPNIMNRQGVTLTGSIGTLEIRKESTRIMI